MPNSSLRIRAPAVALYPILDPLSLEHAYEVDRTILPDIVTLYERAFSNPSEPGAPRPCR
jgi:hypothetical protein